jgi:hypothetical protein
MKISKATIGALTLDQKKDALAKLKRSLAAKTSDGQQMIVELEAAIAAG